MSDRSLPHISPAAEDPAVGAYLTWVRVDTELSAARIASGRCADAADDVPRLVRAEAEAVERCLRAEPTSLAGVCIKLRLINERRPRHADPELKATAENLTALLALLRDEPR